MTQIGPKITKKWPFLAKKVDFFEFFQKIKNAPKGVYLWIDAALKLSRLYYQSELCLYNTICLRASERGDINAIRQLLSKLQFVG